MRNRLLEHIALGQSGDGTTRSRHWTGCRNYVQCYADLQTQPQPNCA